MFQYFFIFCFVWVKCDMYYYIFCCFSQFYSNISSRWHFQNLLYFKKNSVSQKRCIWTNMFAERFFIFLYILSTGERFQLNLVTPCIQWKFVYHPSTQKKLTIIPCLVFLRSFAQQSSTSLTIKPKNTTITLRHIVRSLQTS